MAGLEGFANDFILLKDALSLPPPYGLRVYDGGLTLNNNLFVKFTYLETFSSLKIVFLNVGKILFMPRKVHNHVWIYFPYYSVRYPLKKQAGRTPKNCRELFNLCHSSLWTKIKSTFRILKNRFKILSTKLIISSQARWTLCLLA